MITKKVLESVDKIVDDDYLERIMMRTDLAYFAERVLKMEIVDHHKEWSKLCAEHSRVCINAARDHGKCLAISSTYITLEDGESHKFSDLSIGDRVLSLGADWEIHPRRIEHIEKCGVKSCVRITTQTGKVVDAAETHPFRKYSDWEEAGNLRVGDRIAVLVKRSSTTDNDVLWDKIVSIEPIGEQECWDIQVEGDHNYVANGIFAHNSFFWCFAYAIWRAYHNWMPPLGPEFKSIPRVSLGYIFSNIQPQAIDHLHLIKNEFESNPKLRHLLPEKKEQWSKTEIRLSNGAIIRARGWNVSVRGAHPSWSVCDDVLNDETIYSELVRNKQIDYFMSAITPMIIPGGQIIVVGCVRPDTWVIGKDGICQIKDFSPTTDFSKQSFSELNQPVFGENGFQNASKFWVNGKCKTKKIRTTYGLELEGSYRHPIRVQRGLGPSCRNDYVWKRFDEITKKDRPLVSIGQNVYGNRFDDLEIAYFMGLWIAEGSHEKCGRLTITTSGRDDYLASIGFTKSAQGKWRKQSVEFYGRLKALGLKFTTSHFKEVPDIILSATKKAQQAFIRGFADGDGCSYINESVQQINLPSSSPKLIHTLRAMLMNMGIMPSYQIKPPGVSELVKGKYDSHQLVISAGFAYKFMAEIGFEVKHKRKSFVFKEARQSFSVGIKEITDSENETVDFVIPEDHSFCSNGFISHNTPFHGEDLYKRLEENPEYLFKRYEALMDQERKALWPTRYPVDALLKRKREIGNTRFAREYLCIPVSDESSLFPEAILKQCFDTGYTMPNHLTKDDRDELQVFTGVDLALSSTVGADYTVITTLGVDKYKNRWILDIRRHKGMSMTNQLREIENVYQTYKPSKILIEDNAFQRVFRDELVTRTDMPVEGFTTTARNKNDAERGVPSLQILFENRKFILARQTERDRRITDILCHELRSFSWMDGKLQGLSSHDDCLRKGAPIQTPGGFVNIEDIKIGDMVLTHKGRYRPVTNIIKKPFKGKSYKIHPFGSGPIEVTGEHPIFAATKRGSAKGGDFYRSKWVAAEDVKKGKHRLVFPVLREVNKMLPLDLRKFCEDHVSEVGGRLFYNNWKGNTIERFLKIDANFCKFLGIYLAEGHTRENGQSSLAFHVDEKYLASFSADYLESVGVKVSIEIRGKCAVLQWSNKILGSFLYPLGKHDTKKLPKEFMTLSPGLQKAIYDGWMLGDGWKNIGATTSKDLANQMYIILLRNGIVSNLRLVKRHRYGVKTKDQWWVEVNGDSGNNRKSRLFDGYRYSSIKKIEVNDINEDVYNIEVEEDESYVVNNTIVHNCVMSLWIANECASAASFNFTFA